jgi:peptidoglycan hydrolase CwlO-like protein
MRSKILQRFISTSIFIITMSNIQIESDLKDILNKLDSKIDKLDSKIDKLSNGLTDVKIGQAKLEGKIEALDTKVDQLDKRISNSELTNRGILIGLVVIVLGGAAKLFGLMPNS